jgi:hypothetical protein
MGLHHLEPQPYSFSTLTGEAHSFATLPGAQQQEKVVFENLNVKIPFSVDSFDLKQKNELITFSIMIRL